MFVLTVLSFGLSSARYIFSKLLLPFIKHWSVLGSLDINCVVYLDDGSEV